MKKQIFRRIITFILACSMLLSEIPVYAVSDIVEESETLLQELSLEENLVEGDSVLTVAAPSIELEKDDEGNVTGVTVINNHLEELNIYYGLSRDGSSGLSTYITLGAGASEFFNKEWYLEDDYKEEGTYYFAVMAEGYEEYLDSETVILDYPIIFEEEVSIEKESFVGAGNISGRYYFKDYDVESDKILKVVFEEGYDGQPSQKLINQKYGYYYVEEDSFDEIEKLVYEDWSYTETGVTVQRTSASEFVLEEFAESKIPAPTVALAKDENGNVIGIDVTNNLSKEEAPDGCWHSLSWWSENGTCYAWDELIPPETTCQVLFEEMDFECTGEYVILQARGFGAGMMSYQGEESDVVSCYFPVKITDELQLELSEELWIGTIKEDGTFRIDAYMADVPEILVIPEEIAGYPVTEIGSCAFINCKTLAEVFISEGITSIGDFAFFNCINLKKFELPESVEFVGKNAFNEIFESSDNIGISIEKNGNIAYLCDANGKKLTGYVKNEEKKYYADQNGVLKSGWIKIENAWHYFDESGEFAELEVVQNDGYLYTLEDGSISYFKDKKTLQKNSWITYAKSRYYFDEYGFAVKGWHQDGSYWYYADEITGKMTNTEKVIGENNYYFDGNYRLSTGWKKINNVFRYFNTDKDHEKCYEITMDGTSGWVNLSDGKRAYLNGSSGPIKGWKVIGTYKYHFDSAGFLDVGEFQDGRNYYFGETENTEEEPYLLGSLVKGIRKVGDHVYGYHNKNYYRLTGWQTIDGKRYYFKNDYTAETGWFQESNKWYYAEPTDVEKDGTVVISKGSVAKGLKEIEGKTYLFHSSSYYRLTGWQTMNKQKYYFDENGVLQTGWFKVGEYWHYAGTDGIVQKGLVEIAYGETEEVKNYYFDGNYRLKTGWIIINKTQYYFDGSKNPQDCYAVYSGTVTKGWFTIDGRKSYFNSSLKAFTGWQTISKQRYYFDTNGILQTGWFHVNGYDYYADADGSVKKGLIELSYGETQEEKLYYFDNNYRQKTGWQTINKSRYFFENAEKPEDRYASSTEFVLEPGWLELGNGQKSYVNDNGSIATEWKTIADKKYYFGSNGILRIGWFNVKGYYYYASADGSLVKDFVELPSRDTQEVHTYYFDGNYRQKTGWQTISKQRYYFNGDGELQIDWFTVGKNRYYGEPETTEDGILKGTVAKGIKVIDEETYLFHTSSYYMQTGFKSYGGKRYYLQQDGTAKSGWFTVGTDRYYGERIAGEGIYKGTLASGAKEIDGNTYFFHTKSNYRLTGWQTVSGQRYYLNVDGTAKTGWFTVKNLLYYGEPETTEDGILKGTLAKGAKEIDGQTYVFHSKNYNRLTGWQTVNKKKYYLQSNGIAKSGWMKIGGYWYYGAEQSTETALKGAMETGIIEIDVLDGETTIKNSYYFDSKYRLATGWKTIGKVRYLFQMDEQPQNCYLLYSGAVIKNDWYTYEDGTKSYMDNKGNPVTGWKTINGNKYYFDSKGIMQTGWCNISGADYYFDQDGAHVPMNAPSFKSISSTFYRTADVTWKPVAGAESYRLEYSTSNAFSSWKTTAVVLKNTSVCEYRVEDLEPDTTYYFRIRYTTKKSIAGIAFPYNSPYSAVKSVVVCYEVEPTSTSAVISACEIISGSRTKGINVRIKAALNNRIKSADGKYYIVETESYGNTIDLAKPVGSVDKKFEIDTTVFINAGDGSSVTKECVEIALMNKFALAIKKSNGSYQLISKPMGITNPEKVADNNTPILKPTSKKGLQGIGYDQALDTNSKNTLFNLDLATVVGTKAGNGYVAYKYKGKTYYFSNCSNLVGEFKALEKGILQYVQGETGENNKVCVTLNLLLSYKSANAYLIDPAARTSGHKYYTLNMREEKARETYEALFMYLGELFGKSDCYVTHWILGNEVNSSRAWNYQGSLSFNTYMQVYTSAFRLLYNGVKASKTGNNVYISLDNGWMAKPDTYAGKATLDKFAEYAQAENPKMNWSIAYHGYSYPLTKVDFWNDNTNTTSSTSTKYISMKNISVLTDYAQTLEEKYDKPNGSIRVILSEQGYTASGKNDETAKKQAQALARGYYMAEFNDRVDAFIIRAISDDAEEMKANLYLGLKTYKDVKRITFYTYEFMDSNLDLFAKRSPDTIASSTKNQEKVKEAQNILGATDWISIIPGFSFEKLASMY